jgi:Uncharacterized protein conserved in bacteria
MKFMYALMTKFVALLRGINVGGNKLIKMDDLKECFAALAFKNVKTILASGNVLFESTDNDEELLARKIEKKLEDVLGHKVGVQVRSIDEIQKLADRNPFKKIKVTPETRLYISFLPEKPTSKLKIPYTSPEKDFRILEVTNREICSIVDLNLGRGTVEAMGILDKEFGKNITTRNWNTIAKILNG